MLLWLVLTIKLRMEIKFNIIKHDEYKDFYAILAKHGYEPADFVFKEETAKIKTPPDTEVPHGGISVTCVATHKCKTYPAEVGNPWTKQFEQDLLKGVFKTR